MVFNLVRVVEIFFCFGVGLCEFCVFFMMIYLVIDIKGGCCVCFI